MFYGATCFLVVSETTRVPFLTSLGFLIIWLIILYEYVRLFLNPNIVLIIYFQFPPPLLEWDINYSGVNLLSRISETNPSVTVTTPFSFLGIGFIVAS